MPDRILYVRPGRRIPWSLASSMFTTYDIGEGPLQHTNPYLLTRGFGNVDDKKHNLTILEDQRLRLEHYQNLNYQRLQRKWTTIFLFVTGSGLCFGIVGLLADLAFNPLGIGELFIKIGLLLMIAGFIFEFYAMGFRVKALQYMDMQFYPFSKICSQCNMPILYNSKYCQFCGKEI